jgi:hypothetical protein
LFLLIAIALVKLPQHRTPDRAADLRGVLPLGHISMDSMSNVAARPGIELVFVKSFYCSELKNSSATSLHSSFLASFLH